MDAYRQGDSQAAIRKAKGTTVRQKTYAELTIADDFMFAKIMRNKRLCIRLLEVILKIKIRDIVYIEEQKAINVTYDAKGIRLDVYVEDSEGTVFNIEMQTFDRGNIPKRSRYYQGLIDMNLIERGEDYNNLKNSYIIFICTTDVFGAGRHVYTFENRCLEDERIALKDETRKVFLNASSTMDDVDEELASFLSYVAGGDPTSDFTEEIEEEIVRAKSNEDWKVEYMRYLTLRSELLAEGRAEGRAEGKTETILNLVAEGDISQSLGAKKLGLSEEQMARLYEEYSHRNLALA